MIGWAGRYRLIAEIDSHESENNDFTSKNITSHDTVAERGLSMLVEVDGRKILFDAGAGLDSV